MVNTSERATMARAIAGASSARPRSTFQMRVSLATARRASRLGPKLRAKASARSVSNASSAALRSSVTSCTSAPSAREPIPGAVQDAQHRGLDRQPADVRTPCDAQPGQLAVAARPRTPPDLRGRAESCGSGALIAVSIRARSPTVRASGPTTDAVFHTSLEPLSGTSPGVGRRPTTLLNDAGLRMLPPWSDPSAIGKRPAASAAPAPPLLPPAERSSAHGLRVAPNTTLKVCEPTPNSGVLVLPITIAPAARRRLTSRQSTSGTCSANAAEP